MSYYPASRWNSTGRAVQFAFTYNSPEEAKKQGLFAQNTYKDSTFVAVVKGKNHPDCNEKARKLIEEK